MELVCGGIRTGARVCVAVISKTLLEVEAGLAARTGVIRRNHDSTATVQKSLGCYAQDAYIYEQKSDSQLYGPEVENQNITI